MLIEKIAIFIIFLGPLVFFHELGHFLFARLFGVKVEVFSIGFGPKLFKKKWGDTEYAFSLIPLGGYVKMFGDDPLATDELSDEEKKVAYTAKGKWARFWIVFGGPLANFILAFFIYFSLVVVGENVPQARFGVIPENTKFHEIGIRSGDVLTQINKKDILSFDDLNMIDSEVKSLTLQRGTETKVISVDFIGTRFVQDFASYRGQLRAPIVVDDKAQRYLVADSLTPDFSRSIEHYADMSLDKIYLLPIAEKITQTSKLEELKLDKDNAKTINLDGTSRTLAQLIDNKFFPMDLLVESIVMGSPADKAKLRQGDLVAKINGASLNNFEDLRSAIQKVKEGESASVTVLRGNEFVEKTLTPEFKEVNGQKVLTIGVYSGIVFLPVKMVESKAKGIIDSISLAYSRTMDGMYKTMLGFKKLITAEVALNNIGGPIAIGKVASDSFHISLSMFFRLMAIISINLGIINLFPIPVLDGGHIVFIGLEVLNGGPLSRKKLQVAQQFGMSLLFLLIFVALFNDISRFF